MQNPSSPLVSVVITTKNEQRNIENCLLSILGQSYPNIEIIVVDNGSTDLTKEVARKYTSLVFDHGPERSAQRNYGLLVQAKGVFAIYVDADMILSPGLISAAVARLESAASVALHISEIILGGRFFSRVRRFERSFYDATPIDGARFFRVDTLREVGGFDLNFTGPEDWDLDKKLKMKGQISYLAPEPGLAIGNWHPKLSELLTRSGLDLTSQVPVIYHNEAELELATYLKKKAYYARSFDAYIEKWGKSDPDIRRQFSPLYRMIWVFLENGKWKRLPTKPLLVLGMAFLRFLVGVQFILR
jgi:glycosyltransferase involved in cell wall biosynthesis